MFPRLHAALAALICLAAPCMPVSSASAAELAYPNGIEEGFSLWSSEAEYEAIWHGDPPRDPWLMADTVASTYDVGSRALRAGDGERAYRLWLPLAQAGICRAKFAVGFLLDPASPKALESVTAGGRVASDDERAAAAFAWYLSAAEEGWAGAQRRVGDAYAAGTVVAADPGAAKLWYRRAARNDDPDAMMALARMFLLSDSTVDRVEGFTWTLIARDDRLLFWFDDAEAAKLAKSYESSLSSDNTASARRTASLWWSIDHAIWKGYGDDKLANLMATRSMFTRPTAADESPAARFDAGALAFLEGRNQDALLAWWPLARRGYCQAQFGAAAMLDFWAGGTQPSDFPFPGETLPEYLARKTALAHAAMQGVVPAQVKAIYSFTPGDYIIAPLEQAAGRWMDRAGAQGQIQSIRSYTAFRREDAIP